MREATGGSMLLYIVIFFVGAVLLFFVSMLSYVKAYRAKNRIINIVEDYNFSSNPISWNEEERKNFIAAINADLVTVGYSTSNTKNCTADSSYASCADINTASNGGGLFDYCICVISADMGGYYFEVITYNQFSFPIIGEVISNAVRGETKIMGIDYTHVR